MFRVPQLEQCWVTIFRDLKRSVHVVIIFETRRMLRKRTERPVMFSAVQVWIVADSIARPLSDKQKPKQTLARAIRDSAAGYG